VAEIVRLLVDVVSKNGNLLLSFGPMADGTVPELQRERLEGLGSWLDANGEAIFGTRPWLAAEGNTRERIPVRFTHKADTLYAALWDLPRGGQVTLEGLQPNNHSAVHLLGSEHPLLWQQKDDTLVISAPSDVAVSPVYCLKITPTPRLLTRVSD
jgi:alpha-L-fucosidase